VRGNMTHALHALGGTATSVWHGRGMVHIRSGAGASRGIGHRGQHEAGGEVMDRAVVGGALPMLGCQPWPR
jgi:hypothetical protein